MQGNHSVIRIESAGDLRAYPRFPIHNERVAYASIHGHPIGRIAEISFGGFTIEPIPGSHRPLLAVEPKQKRIRIHFLDQYLDCTATAMSEKPDGAIGFAFHHESAAVHLFLREFLPYMYLGAAAGAEHSPEFQALTAIAQRLEIEDGIQGALTIEGNDAEGLPNFTVELSLDGIYYRMQRQNNQLRTWHSIGFGGAPKEDLIQTPEVDPFIVRHALCFLLGYFTTDSQVSVDEIINYVLNLRELNTVVDADITIENAA